VRVSLRSARLASTLVSTSGGVVFKARRLVYHSTVGSRVIKKKKKHQNVEAHARALEGVAKSRFDLPYKAAVFKRG